MATNSGGGRTMVSVVKAAEALTAAGDPITPSNVSRYLIRFPDIPSEKQGRERMVDLVALMEHRRENVRVLDRQAARAVDSLPDPLRPVAAPPNPPPEADVELTSSGPENQTMGEINLALKQLELRRRQREEDEADGKSVSADEVRTIVLAAMQTMIASMEEQEPLMAQRFGRDVAQAFRLCRKAAQAKAASVLTDMAQRHLPPQLGGIVADAATLETNENPPAA